MRHLTSYLHAAVLAAIGLLATAAILSVPTFADVPASLWELLVKAAGVGLLALDLTLFRRWRETDPWVRRYDRRCQRMARGR